MNSEIHPPIRGPDCPPTVVLEAMSAGEKPEPEAAAHVPQCAACSGYVSALSEAHEEYARSRPPELFLRKLERHAAEARLPQRARWWSALAGLGAVGAAAIVALIAVNDPNGGITVKGGEFRVVARVGTGPAEPVAHDSRLRPGAKLRFSYEADEPGHLLVLNLDGAGRASVFHPFNGTASAPHPAGSREFVPGSVELDETPGAEWLVAVFSERPLEAGPLLAQLREQGGANEPDLECDDCRVSAVRLLKAP